MTKDMTAIILAGGKSSRMGFDKAFAEIDGIALIEREIRLLSGLFSKIIIVTNTPHKYICLNNILIIQDNIPHQGPLGGICSGLMASSSFYNFVVGCDMPFINTHLIEYMIGIRGGLDAVVPKVKGRHEALFAIYSKDCITPIAKMLEAGELKVSRLFNNIKVNEVSEDKIRQIGDPGVLFTNLNTKEDLLRVRNANI